MDGYLSAAEAADHLGVKRATLYAYVSRGWVESVPDPRSSRGRLYRREDLERLKARAGARSGEAPVAAAALRWGAPVLETRISEITPRGPTYRGHALGELVELPFEIVATLLWSGTIQQGVKWSGAGVRATMDGAVQPIDRLRLAVLHCELGDPARDVRTPEAAAAQSERLLLSMAASVGPETRARGSFSARVSTALGGEGKLAERAVNTALVVCAEHELNASTFAARVAASTGANLYACVSAGLAAFVGPRHGGMGRRITRLLAEVSEDPRAGLIARLQAGESIPGFGHPLYAGGDPRVPHLLEAARAVDARALTPIEALVEAAAELGLGEPHLDMGLVALARACGLVDGSEAALFALGRTAGWLAHAREQAEQGFLLRPRAHYVGTTPE